MLADIELAQSLQAQKEKEEEEVKVEEVPHPLDKDYELLKCELTLVDPASEDYQVWRGWHMPSVLVEAAAWTGERCGGH